jgi:hypoxanthine phosphoribosyltransferase
MIDLTRAALKPVPSTHRSDALEGVLITKEDIDEAVRKLAAKIGKGLHCLVVLKGALIFASDLIRELTDCTYDTIQVASYVGQDSTRQPRVYKDITIPVKGREVLVVEDIVDTGHSLRFLVQHLKSEGAKRVEIVSLLSKPSRREVDVRIDHCGFLVPDEFLVGYGLDCDERFRNLPFIAVMRKQ